MLIAAVVLPSQMHTPTQLPAVALGSTWILYIERGLAILIALLFALVLVIRGVVEGNVPATVGRDGFGWVQEVAQTASDATSALQEQLDSLEADVGALTAALAAPAAIAYEVFLRSSGARKISVIKAVRAATGLGLKDAKDLVDAAPGVVHQDMSFSEAEALVEALREAGADAVARASYPVNV